MDAPTLLRDVFGFSSFRPGQGAVCDALLAGRSAIAVFPTGGGKSLCYQLPALLLEGTTLVVSPLLALMKDQVDWLQAHGVAAARLDSTLSQEESRAVFDGLSSGTLKLLYVAPERFLNERFLDRLKRTNIAMLAIDEAHCISQWGHNFRPEYLKLAAHARNIGVRRVLALTATATPRVVLDIAAAFEVAPADRIVTGFYRHNLSLSYIPVRRSDRDRALLAQPFAGPTIVYVTLQKTAERVAKLLSDRGIRARAYHAGMESDVRAQVQDSFMGATDQVIVATIAFGMGIDKSDIRAVIHYNLPKSLESYAQEIGRAGRDGAPSACTTLACRDDLPTLANFVYGDTPTREAVDGVVRTLLANERTGAERADSTPRIPASVETLTAERAAADAKPGSTAENPGAKHPRNIGVSFRALSDRFDMRELVVKTLVTWLELDGWVKQGTPVYTEYKWKWLTPRATVVATFDPARQGFLNAVFDAAAGGRIWDRIDAAEVSEKLGEPRDRIVRALDYLAEKGHIELVATGVQEQIVRLREPTNLPALVDELTARFEAIEGREVARVHEIAAFIEGEGCHTRRMVAYFGEELGRDCGHCTGCRERVALLPATPGELPDRTTLDRLRAEHPVLASARAAARFFCGVTSPALTKAKLTRHPAFGSAADVDFRDVMRWAS